MTEFRVKWKYNYAGIRVHDDTLYYPVDSMEDGLLVLNALYYYDRQLTLDLHHPEGLIEFNHPSLGWVDLDTNDYDDDLEGEAYLSQSG